MPQNLLNTSKLPGDAVGSHALNTTEDEVKKTLEHAEALANGLENKSEEKDDSATG